MMTRKDFIIFADAVNTMIKRGALTPQDGIEVASTLAAACSECSRNFKYEKFMDACTASIKEVSK
tara:strand:- start:393 stop:587 length:195 start_codon:yes stop_codon:yes gene_type:complete